MSDAGGLSEKDLILLHEQKISEIQRDNREIEKSIETTQEQLKQLIERINMGVAPTQQKILDKSNAIEILIGDLRSKFEVTLVKIEATFKYDIADIQRAVESQGRFMDNFKKVWVWGILGAVLILVVTTVWNVAISKISTTGDQIKQTRTYKK
jgi:t-SNARE complex subunit (syntaxin)